MLSLVRELRAAAASEDGATMVEYGLMLAFIAAVCILAVATLGGNLNTLFSNPALVNAL